MLTSLVYRGIELIRRGPVHLSEVLVPFVLISLRDRQKEKSEPEPFDPIFEKEKEYSMGLNVKTKPITTVTGQELRGIKITPRNINTLAQWSDGQVLVTYGKRDKDGVTPTISRIKVHTKAGWRVGYADDTLAKDKAGYFQIIKAGDYDKVVVV